MTRILLPTDFSPILENVEDYADDITRRKSAKLILLHVEDDEELYRADIDVMQESSATRLKKIIENHQLEGFPHECLVEEGEVTQTILRMIKDLEIDIVVMGSNGNDNYERSNSNATEIIRKAKCSVLTIPKKAKFKPITTIVYATDLIHKDGQAFDHLVKFAKLYDAKITLLHVNIDGKDVPGKAPLKSIPEIMNEIKYSRIESKVIVSSSLMEGLEDYSKENEVDVIAMTSHSNTLLDRFFRDSETEKMVLSTDIPILTFTH